MRRFFSVQELGLHRRPERLLSIELSQQSPIVPEEGINRRVPASGTLNGPLVDRYPRTSVDRGLTIAVHLETRAGEDCLSGLQLVHDAGQLVHIG